MISVFTIAEKTVKEHRLCGTLRVAFLEATAASDSLSVSTVLSPGFTFERQLYDQWLRRLEAERGKDIFQQTISPLVHPYELPTDERFSQEKGIAEQQMKWGALSLVRRAFNIVAKDLSEHVPYQKILKEIDRLQKICAITDIMDWRVGGERVNMNVMKKISLPEARDIADVYNSILNRAYGYGPEPLFEVKDSNLISVQPEGLSTHDILRIEKFDRLRKGAKLR